MLLCIDNNDFDLLKIISKSVKDMSQGELLQIEKARRLDIDEQTYFEIIKKKTASLISSCCALGAAASNVSENKIDELASFGQKIGIAFQLKDDLFDYGNKKIGKPIGIDLREKKLTLPLIFTLNNSSKSKKRWLINCIKNHSNNKKVIQEMIEHVKETGGIEYTLSKLKEFQSDALKDISKFPENQYRESLICLVNYVIDREY